MDNPFIGEWRITEVQGFDLDDLDEVDEAMISFEDNNRGDFRFCLYDAWTDYRVGQRGGHVAAEFSWEGTQDSTPISGRGWVVPKDQHIVGIIFVHGDSEYSFVASRK